MKVQSLRKCDTFAVSTIKTVLKAQKNNSHQHYQLELIFFLKHHYLRDTKGDRFNLQQTGVVTNTYINKLLTILLEELLASFRARNGQVTIVITEIVLDLLPVGSCGNSLVFFQHVNKLAVHLKIKHSKQQREVLCHRGYNMTKEQEKQAE